MGFPSTTTKFHIQLGSFLVLLSVTIAMQNSVKSCNFPAIFNFGASNSDTGGFAAAFIGLRPPFGETYFHRPAGRISDGRIILDFIAQNFGLPYLSAYLDSLGTNFSTGANFATLGSTIRPPGPNALSPFSLDVQFTQFKNFIPRTQFIKKQGPLGCYSSFLTRFPSAEKDNYGCAKIYNEVCQYFNLKLKEALAQLRKDLPHAAITYVDIYSAKFSLFQDPKKYGFEQPHAACCGYGGKYNFNSNYYCGGTIKVNGTNVLVGSCKNPSARILWDGIHYTEAANKIVFDKISTGAFTDPPIPLNMACHKSVTES
ncbi:hypothetical protein RIF29_16764 [Crotalaria pallida]|uniref:Uncharacterized protein n=1 Tax=Crotalaria pallida TaxID=3830 RepID=A0AAN9FH89_CROPI